MTLVYNVRGDVNIYESLLVDGAPAPPFNGTPMTDTWVPPAVYSPQPTLITPDIWVLGSTLVFPSALAGKLGHILAPCGELLPLPYNDETWWVLNVLPPFDCLDRETSTWAEVSYPDPKKMAFIEHRLPGVPLFKPVEQRVSTFCSEGLADREDEFKPVVEDLGLTGLTFIPLWDSDDPSVFATQCL